METKVDGYVSFSGGMDSSRSPSVLGKNQYVWSINCVIPKSSEGIANRKGFRPIEIKFTLDKYKAIWETGNPQGCGSFIDERENEFLLYVVNGFVFELRSINNFTKEAKILNLGNQNDPKKKHVWITTIPGGAIINDGQDAPIFTNGIDSRRTRPSKREIGAGLMAVYVQNRLWYVKPNRKEIWASTIKQPLSLDEAYIDNIFGVASPDDKKIQAIGKQGTIGRDAVGGDLAFATKGNYYTVDVRGARTNWGVTGGQATGFVDNTLPGLGAISGNSFESFNGNIFFRHSTFGLISLNQGRSEFANKDAFSKQTIEASLFFDNDTKFFLDSCYTKKYGKSIYTTIAPQHRDGFVYWNGLLVKTPDPYYGKQSEENKFTDIVESIWTGLRPWNIQTVGEVTENFYVLSYDFDCVNRLYVYDEYLDHDINYKKQKVAIESQLLTKAFSFQQPFFPKIGMNQLYSLDNITQDTEITVLTRTTEYGEFEEQSKLKFLVANKCDREGKIACDKCPESRDNISIANDKTKDYFTRQDLFLIKGSCSLRRWIRTADVNALDKTAYKQDREPNKAQAKCDSHKLFTYKISV